MLLPRRVLAALNAAFQLPVGLLAIFAPTVAGGLFALDVSTAPVSALARMFGGLLAGAGLLSGLLALRPDQPILVRRVFGAALLLNVATDLGVLAVGELSVGQLAGGMILQAAFGVLLMSGR